jgi:hypothetical protein
VEEAVAISGVFWVVVSFILGAISLAGCTWIKNNMQSCLWRVQGARPMTVKSEMTYEMGKFAPSEADELDEGV